MHPVPPQTMRAAQILTSLTMAAFLAAGWFPPLRRHAGRIRLVVLVLFLLGCAALTISVFL